MAIATDAFSSVVSNSASVISGSHSCGGSNRIMWIGFSTSGSVRGVRVEGTPATFATRSPVGGQPVYLYFRVNPLSGENSWEVETETTTFIYADIGSYTGAKQSDQPDAVGANFLASTSVSTSVVTIADNSWAVLVARNDDDGNTDAGTGSTERIAATGYAQFYDNGPKTPAGSLSMTVTNAGAFNTTTAMASFSPAPDEAAGEHDGRYVSLMGVGT